MNIIDKWEKSWGKLLGILLVTIFSVIVFPMIWNHIKPKDIWGEFYVIDLRIPSDFNFKLTQHEDIEVIRFKIHNKKEEDIYIQYLEVKFIDNFRGVNIKWPSSYDARYKNLPYEIVNSDRILKISGNIPVPATDSTIVYLWANRISKIPDLICKTNKGSIDIEWTVSVDNKIKYLIYDNIYLIIISFVVLMIFICMRFKKDSDDKERN